MATVEAAPDGVHTADRRGAWVLIALYLMVGSVAFTFVKVALKELTPLGLAAGRVVTSALTYVAVVAASPRRRTSIAKGHRVTVLLCGLVGSAGFHVLFAWGQQRVSIAVSAVIFATMPAITAIGEVLFLSHRFRPHHIVGLVLSTVGCVLIGVHGSGGSTSVLGALAIFGSVLAWAAVTVATRKVASVYDQWWFYTPGTVVGAVLLLGLEAPHLSEFVHLSFKGWLVVIWLGSASSAFVYYALARIMTVLPATTTVSIGSVLTPTTVLVAWAVLGTAPTWFDVIGGCVVIGGVMLVTRDRVPFTRQRTAAPAPTP
jgi:drug/metabolite transporter (DMT)-like permease